MKQPTRNPFIHSGSAVVFYVEIITFYGDIWERAGGKFCCLFLCCFIFLSVQDKLSSIFVESTMCKIFGMTFPKVLKRTFLCYLCHWKIFLLNVSSIKGKGIIFYRKYYHLTIAFFSQPQLFNPSFLWVYKPYIQKYSRNSCRCLRRDTV